MGSEKEDVPPWKRELLSRRRALSQGGENKRHFHPPVANMRLLESDQQSFNTHQDHARPRIMVEEKKPQLSRPRQRKDDRSVEDDYGSDSSEELQYGPGIVNKLKTKYLSMTLRENQKRNARPSLASLRRATSLENMLDEDTETQAKARYVKKNSEGQKITRVSAKYLARGPGSESMKRARSMDTLLRNEPKCKNASAPAVAAKPSPIINEDLVIVESPARDTKCPAKNGVLTEGELPPPDLVKQTLKIFEPSSKKAPAVVRPKPKLSPKPPSKPPFQSKPALNKPSISPKPVLSPEKRAVRPKLPPPPPVKQVVPVVSALKAEPTPEKPPVPQRTFASPTAEQENFKYISQLALENIGKEGASFKYCFNDIAPDKSHLPGHQDSSVAQATNTALIQYSPERQPKTAETVSSPVKQIAVIRPVNKLQQAHHLTDQEIEKNHINRVKSIEPPSPPILPPSKVIRNDSASFPNERCKNNLAPSSHNSSSVLVLGSCENIIPPPATANNTKANQHNNLWDKKPFQSQNSVVFNFQDRKSIPDYIGPKGQLNGNNEDDPDGCEEDFSGPPSPCNIRFIGDNVLINGKSSLRKEPRQHKSPLRIKFNDEATTLFEYPADDYSCSEDSPTTGLPSSMALGGGNLSNYTPYKSGSVDSFELGVTRATGNISNSSSNISSSSSNSNASQQQQEDYLRPVDSDDITPWSQETAADLLF